MALQDLLLDTRGCLPEPDCPVIGSRRDRLPVRREGYCVDPGLMALQDLLLSTRGRLPEPDYSILGSRRDCLPVR